MTRKLIAVLMLIAALAAAAMLPLVETHGPRGLAEMEQHLFFPLKHPRGDWDPQELRFDDVYFTTEDNTRLHGWFCPSDRPAATILFAHGNAGNITSRTRLLRFLQSHVNASIFAFDYRGYGRSEGIPTVDGIRLDARAAYTKLCELTEEDRSELIFMGESLGGAVMVELAAETAPKAIVLQSTFSSLRDVADVHFPKRSWIVPADLLNSTTAISRFHGPILQSHGTHDRVIPFASGDKLFRFANEPKSFVTIVRGTHNDWMTDEYLRRLSEFIEQLTTAND